MEFAITDRRLRAGCLAVLLAGACVARAAGAPRAGAISVWERAERARDAFEAVPEAARTRAEYARVMDEFRAIYHERPQDVHAAEAVNAVAELLAEEGRGRRDAGVLRAAVGQYAFLRAQYPGSSLRVGALLAEAQIEQNDLRDREAARERYTTFLKSYPRSSVAEEARAGLVSLDAGTGQRSGRAAGELGAGTRQTQASAATPAGAGVEPVRGDGAALSGASGTSGGAGWRAGSGASPARVDGRGAGAGDRDGVAVEGAPGSAGGAERAAATPETRVAAPIVRAVARPVGKLAMVTGIRHWSTPSYTRVAIDLGDAVEYEAARVPSPDRIYFDLHGARLAPELVGKSFAVTDDGFLKKIRVAQSGGNFARIVLDVNEVTEYSAFLLPNPYRLIIDIHGRSKPAGAAVASVDAPARAAATVPNTRAMSAGSSAEVTRLSEQPGKVEATTVPTSQPIAAVIAGRGAPGSASGMASSSGLPAMPTTGATLPVAGGAPVVGPATGVGRSGSTASPAASASVSGTSGTSAGVASAAAASHETGLGGAVGRRGRRGHAAAAADARVVGDPGVPARAAVKTAEGETSLVRALGLKINRIVIDAGHGGHDSGTIGVEGLEEKDVVLDVALRLGSLLHERLGAEVIYTRSDDTFVPLETRTAIANKAQADLFLSIHANSSPEPSARGVETYYLNFTAQPDALEVAARENAVSGQSIHQLSDLVKKITLKDKIAESREFATDVEQGLYGGLARGNEGLKDRGVKKAPFVVLIGANMPSVLAEISFVTNARDAGQLRQPEYRERVAESLFKGVSRYAGGLSGTGPAMVARANGQ